MKKEYKEIHLSIGNDYTFRSKMVFDRHLTLQEFILCLKEYEELDSLNFVLKGLYSKRSWKYKDFPIEFNISKDEYGNWILKIEDTEIDCIVSGALNRIVSSVIKSGCFMIWTYYIDLE